MTPPDIAAVAGKLSEQQKTAIINWMRVYSDPNTMRAIRRKGLAYRSTLTDLGKAVRAHLLENGGG